MLPFFRGARKNAIRGLVFLAVLAVQNGMPDPASAQTSGPFHPMDALTVREITKAVSVLRDGGHVDDATRFADVRLYEIPKPQMLAWKPGMALPRSAFVIFIKDKGTYEAVVDLTAGKITSVIRKHGVQPSILQEEWDKARTATKADKNWQAAIRRRGFKDYKGIFCTPISAGYFGEEKYKGRRLMRVPCYASHAPTKDPIERLYRQYGVPIEGLHTVVDTDTGEVLDVVDTGAVELDGVSGSPSGSALATQRAPLKPVLILSPQGANFRLSGGIMVDWQKWSFHLRAERRTGPVISLVRYRDAGRRRLVAYQMALSEMFVPYMDDDPNWFYRGYLDAGEYGIGYLASSLSPGRDCPLQSAYISVIMPSDKGGAFRVQRGMCIFERNSGDPLWRHENIATQKTESRPGVELVVRMATVIGNYDYLIDWVFSQNGNIQGRVGAAGIVAVKGVTQKSVQAAKHPPKTGEVARGTLVSPNMLAVFHDHFFSFRLDLDIEGQANQLVRDRLVRKRLKPDGKRRSLWAVEREIVEKEGPLKPRLGEREIWRVINPHGRTRLGHSPSFQIMPGKTVTSVLSDDDFPQRRAAFSAHKLWVSAYRRDEKYASGPYPNLHAGGDGLPAYVADKASVRDKDLVLWYTMGFHHVTRVEDWPVMPTMWHNFTLRPFNFFNENPSINVSRGFSRPAREAPSKPGLPSKLKKPAK